MDNASLDDRVGEHGGDRVREALQAADNGKQDVFDATVPELVHHPQPELGAFILLEPQAEHLLGAIGADAQRDADRLVANHVLVADLDLDRVEEDQRVNRIKRPLLPSRNLIEHGVGHRADQIGRDVDAVQIVQVPGDLAGAHTPRVHRHDLLVEAGEAALVFGYQLRVKARLAVARHVNRQLARLGQHGFPAVTIARVADAIFSGQMVIHLRFQGAFVSAFFRESSRPPCSNAELAAPPAKSWSRSSFGIVGSLRRDIVELLFTHYARPHTEILAVLRDAALHNRPGPDDPRPLGRRLQHRAATLLVRLCRPGGIRLRI